MSAPDAPEDRSVELRQMELDAAEQARLREEAAQERRRQELAQLRTDAFTAGRGNVNQYLTQQGLDPNAYAGDIESEINRIMSTVSREDPNPGAYFANAGQSVYNTLEQGQRNRQGRALDDIFAPNFEMSRITDTMDDPFLASYEAEQRASADDIIRNMLNRGVITAAGSEAAGRDLDRQSAGVKARLNEVGTGQLAKGRSSLRDVANRGRSTAANLRLGQQFDPFSFSTESDRVLDEFIANLGNNIRASAPGNLFNTTGLAAVAGAGQGAQNTAFNPKAASGIIEDDEDENERTAESIF